MKCWRSECSDFSMYENTLGASTSTRKASHFAWRQLGTGASGCDLCSTTVCFSIRHVRDTFISVVCRAL